MTLMFSLLALLFLSGVSHGHVNYINISLKYMHTKDLFDFQKFNRSKYNKKALVDIKANLVDLTADIEALKLTVAQLQECVNTPVDDETREEKCPPPPGERTTISKDTDMTWVASMYLSNTGDRCGPQVQHMVMVLLIIISEIYVKYFSLLRF